MGDQELEPQDAKGRQAARRVGCILSVVILLLLALPFVFKLWH